MHVIWKVKQLAPSKQIDLNDRHDTLKHLFCIYNYLARTAFFQLFSFDCRDLFCVSHFAYMIDANVSAVAYQENYTHFPLVVAKWNLID